MNQSKKNLIGCLLFAAVSVSALADVKLPGIFGNDMVLQQGMPVKIWGWASPSESVSVSFAEDKAQTLADEKGEWKLELPAQKASATSARFTVKANNEIVLENVLVGEVWLCSGQSNMAMGLQATENAGEEIAAAGNPELRLFCVPMTRSPSPQVDVAAKWKVSSPQTILPADIHPKRKKEVGARLALQALQKTYGRKDIVADGPSFKSFSTEGEKLRVCFDNVPAGLKSSDGKKLNGFEILDADKGGFVEAEAEIDGKTVLLSAGQVTKPVAVRFAWNNVAAPNLASTAGLPAYPFRAAGPEAMRIFRALSGAVDH